MKTCNDFLDEIFNTDRIWLNNYRNKRYGQPFVGCTFFNSIYLHQQLGQFSPTDQKSLTTSLKDAWRQRRATLRRRDAAKFDHKITISYDSEEYLRDLCRRTDKSISHVIDDLLMKEAKKKQKSKSQPNPFSEQRWIQLKEFKFNWNNTLT